MDSSDLFMPPLTSIGAIRLKEQNEIIKEAEIKLRQWDNEKIESEKSLNNARAKLEEQRVKNTLYNETILQGKLIQSEEDTTNKKTSNK